MSYDLFFCTPEGSSADPAELLAWSERVGRFERHKTEGGFQLLYENKETGVYFAIEYAAVGFEQDPEARPPEGLDFSGISFNLNYLRPAFFAHEAMPLVEEMARELSLLVLDPQGDAKSTEEPRSDDLIARWVKSNEWAAAAAAGSAPMPRMPREKSLAWWRYMKGHSHLQIELGEDIFVPQILILKRKETGELLTTVTWPQAIPEVFPPCDLLAIDKVEKRYLGLVKRKEIGLVSASRAMESVGPYLDGLDAHVPLKVLGPQRAPEVESLYRRLDFEWPADDFEGVPPDGFVDYEE